MLLGVLCLFTAALAQAQTTVWSATLTPKGLGEQYLLGCNSERTEALCANVLVPNKFTYNGVDYTVRFLINNTSSTNKLSIGFDPAIDRTMLFRVDNTKLTFTASLTNSREIANWGNSGVSWASDQEVQLSLEPYILSVNATPACGLEDPDTSLPLSYALELTPLSDTDVPIERRVVAKDSTEWLPALPIEGSAGSSIGRSIRSTGHAFPDLRNAYDGFRGFEFRLKDIPKVTAECTWTFREDPVRTPPPPPPPISTLPSVSAPPTDGGPAPEEPSDPAPDSPRCGESNREDLERFYEASGGDNWHENENWKSTTESLGEWHGVETDEDGNVVSLRLPDNNLSGDMPTRELRCLTELVELSLWDNDDLSGEVPEELVLAVERAVLRDIAETLDLNPDWFKENYEDPFNFKDWHAGVTTDDKGRVTELDFSEGDIEGEIPKSISELKRLVMIETGCGVTLEAEAPEGVNVTMPDDCAKETAASGDWGCALSAKDDSSVFGLFLLTLVVFAVMGRKRAGG